MEEMSRVLNSNQKRNQKIKEDQNVKLSNVVLFPFMDTFNIIAKVFLSFST